ncbi:MAG: lyase family protein, partial [Gammaproteobacteria bacterium]
VRLAEIGPRLAVGQIAGGVGTLSSFGEEASALQRRVLFKLGLDAPAVSWTASRDRLAEWLNLLTLIVSTADRIGHEVYNLQRPEIGELAEGFVSGTVGSITMPQKRNPEISEHLGTLSRYVRHQAAFMNENLVHDHERDGRSWKGEWSILPGACLAAGKSLALLETLLENLQIDAVRMRGNLMATKGFVHAEQVMLRLASSMGKQSAHALVYRVAMAANDRGITLKDALLSEPEVVSEIGADTIENLFDLQQSTGCCAEMVERVVGEVEAWDSNRGRSGRE